jgi:hypothetical protein
MESGIDVLAMIYRSISDSLLPVAGLMPAGTVVKGWVLFQSRMAVRWVAMAVDTLFYFLVSGSFRAEAQAVGEARGIRKSAIRYFMIICVYDQPNVGNYRLIWWQFGYF